MTAWALAHTPAFCRSRIRSRIRLRSWSFSHVPALPLPVVSLILNAAQRRCLCIDRLRYLKHRQVQIRVQVATQLHWNWQDKPAAGPACRVPVRHANLPGRQFGRTGCVWKRPYLHCIRRRSRTRLRFCRCVCKRPKTATPPTFYAGKETRHPL